MGNRDALLAGARRCLEEKGWARTTVRDIASAAGVSMAAIGYHFGSRELLLSAALVEAMDEWGRDVADALAAARDPEVSPAAYYEATWTRLIESINAHRTLWLANLEALVQAEHTPALREHLMAAQRESRRGMAAALDPDHRPEATLPDDTVRTVGSVQLALLTGIMLQWLNDPDHAPSASEILSGVRAIAATCAPHQAVHKKS